MSSLNDNKNAKLKIKEIIDGGMTFIVMPHIHPDGDSMGSTIAFCEYLRSLGKKAFVVVNETIPSYLSYISKGYTNTTHSLSQAELANIDAAFVLDCGDLSRIEDRLEYYNKAAVKVNIDHHATNEYFADVNYVFDNASSTGEIIYDLIKDYGYGFNPLAMKSIYTSISSDTGSFKYSNTSSNTHRVAGELIDMGLDTAGINVELYQNKSFTSFQALRIALNNVEIISNGKMAISYIPLDDFKKYNLRVEDTDGIVETLRDIDSVEVSAFLREIENGVFKVSLRSKRYFDLTVIATMFSGGGHKRASGCRVKGTINESKKILIKAINEEFALYDTNK